MTPFPAVDPIPLPAPVWIFKLLHLVTFALHVVALQLLVGGLIVALTWYFWNRARPSAAMAGAAGSVAGLLPIVMVYVINLGIPPLLFTQVLYGRALYTASILVGAFWLGIIALLLLGYSCLYAVAGRSTRQKAWGWIGLIAVLAVGKIAFTYSNVMTLMLRPPAWLEMYRSNPHGTQLAAPGDPTIMPRWLYMILGSLVVAGVGLWLLGHARRSGEETGTFLRQRAPLLIVLFGVAQAALNFWVVAAQPAAVREGVTGALGSQLAMGAWALTLAGMVAAGVLALRRQGQRAPGLAWACAALSVLNIGAMVLFRDAIRDTSLGQFGYNVWDRQVATNWSAVIVFLVMFLVTAATLVWLVKVAAGSKQGEQTYA
jgi:hypothetical protein